MTEELQADRASDRRIAERLGFEVKYRGTMENPVLFIDDGSLFGPELPRYTTSLDAAMRLANRLEEGEALSLSFSGGLWLAHFVNPGVSGGFGKGNFPALAVCRAWWAWMDREE